jgi:mRNA interferase MazF
MVKAKDGRGRFSVHIKDFQGWNKFKEKLSNKLDNKVPTIKEREVWWCSIGINIGDEEDGKGDLYNRPVLVVKKFNKRIFWGVPTTAHIKSSPLYININIRGIEQCVMLSHLRLYDTKRLQDNHSKMVKLPPKKFEEIKTALKNLL